jgi:hypothetical protein
MRKIGVNISRTSIIIRGGKQVNEKLPTATAARA